MRSDNKTETVFLRLFDGIHPCPGKKFNIKLGDGLMIHVGLIKMDKGYIAVELDTGLIIPVKGKTQTSILSALRSSEPVKDALRLMIKDVRHWNIMVADMDSELKRYHREHPEDINNKSAD